MSLLQLLLVLPTTATTIVPIIKILQLADASLPLPLRRRQPRNTAQQIQRVRPSLLLPLPPLTLQLLHTFRQRRTKQASNLPHNYLQLLLQQQRGHDPN